MQFKPTPAQIRAGILGLLVGDALGVPYEFHSPSALPPTIEFDPPPSFSRSHRGVAPGSWSDDGAMALCLAASLAEEGRLNLEDLGGRFVKWYDQGYMAANSKVFDIGITTVSALRRIQNGDDVATAGGREVRNNGNGSLMRVLPLALWHRGSDRELVEDAHRQSCITHGHLRSQVCCALYCLWARGIMQEREAPFDDAVSTLRSLYNGDALRLGELEGEVLSFSRPRGSGYVVDCLHSARQALAQSTNYEEAVVAAVRFGDDTDTTACVTGGLAALKWGEASIPERWLGAMQDQALYERVITALQSSLA